MNREAIYTALFNKLKTNATLAVTVKTFSRRLKLWDQMSDSEKPAIFLVQGGDAYAYTHEQLPGKVTLAVKLLIYTAASKDSKIVPATQLNNILDAIDTALAADPVTKKQTLGGLVTHCRIEGNNGFDDGALDLNGVTERNIAIYLPVTGV